MHRPAVRKHDGRTPVEIRHVHLGLCIHLSLLSPCPAVEPPARKRDRYLAEVLPVVADPARRSPVGAALRPLGLHPRPSEHDELLPMAPDRLHQTIRLVLDHRYRCGPALAAVGGDHRARGVRDLIGAQLDDLEEEDDHAVLTGEALDAPLLPLRHLEGRERGDRTVVGHLPELDPRAVLDRGDEAAPCRLGREIDLLRERDLLPVREVLGGQQGRAPSAVGPAGRDDSRAHGGIVRDDGGRSRIDRHRLIPVLVRGEHRHRALVGALHECQCGEGAVTGGRDGRETREDGVGRNRAPMVLHRLHRQRRRRILRLRLAVPRRRLASREAERAEQRPGQQQQTTGRAERCRHDGHAHSRPHPRELTSSSPQSAGQRSEVSGRKCVAHAAAPP